MEQIQRKEAGGGLEQIQRKEAAAGLEQIRPDPSHEWQNLSLPHPLCSSLRPDPNHDQNPYLHPRQWLSNPYDWVDEGDGGFLFFCSWD